MRLWVRGEITPDTAVGFVARVKACKDDEIIEVLVDSPGCEYSAALSMVAALMNSKAQSTGILLCASSAALQVAVACDRRIAASDGAAFLHDGSMEWTADSRRTANELHAAAESLEQKQRFAEQVLALQTGTPTGIWRCLMGAGTELNAAGMLATGIASEISQWPKSHFVNERSDDWIQRFADIVEATLLRAKDSVAVGFNSELLASHAALSRTILRNVHRFGYRGTAIEEMAQRQLDSAEAALRYA